MMLKKILQPLYNGCVGSIFDHQTTEEEKSDAARTVKFLLLQRHPFYSLSECLREDGEAKGKSKDRTFKQIEILSKSDDPEHRETFRNMFMHKDVGRSLIDFGSARHDMGRRSIQLFRELGLEDQKTFVKSNTNTFTGLLLENKDAKKEFSEMIEDIMDGGLESSDAPFLISLLEMRDYVGLPIEIPEGLIGGAADPAIKPEK